MIRASLNTAHSIMLRPVSVMVIILPRFITDSFLYFFFAAIAVAKKQFHIIEYLFGYMAAQIGDFLAVVFNSVHISEVVFHVPHLMHEGVEELAVAGSPAYHHDGCTIEVVGVGYTRVHATRFHICAGFFEHLFATTYAPHSSQYLFGIVSVHGIIDIHLPIKFRYVKLLPYHLT